MVNTEIRLISILCSWKRRSSIQLAKTRPAADYDSDRELLISKHRLILKKVGETARPFRYDWNKTPYDYTVEMMNRFKGLDLVDRVPEELWTRFKGLDLVDGVPEELWTEIPNPEQEAVTKTTQRSRNERKAKRLSEEALEIAEERRAGQGTEERKRYIQLNTEF